MKRRSLLLAAPALAGFPARAQGAGPVVVELFTSQSCSSCPAADALLVELAQRAEVLALSFHVTYWDRLGWRDRFSLREATDRQRAYATTMGRNQVYTPQAVVQGRADAVGSDRAALLGAIGAARAATVPLRLVAGSDQVSLGIGAGIGAGGLWLVGYDRRHVTAIGAGENGGRTLTHANVVRSLARIGDWHGGAHQQSVARPAGERVAALLQAPDGGILGAATA
ncbi:DUF1223 domain-containing protein [Plastoroseomonas arctica]|uniref:DUF1223 domain-containing protein n=1 Tax=Plastoroseomonas arctica TaxID=1509237 RepID=A0AAF1JZL3_9PROT|nr:DUF1223 domain-containing protein [Plastoroseomonas arctica]MBR0655898.1 DUF1223 domain-containing protein [Plastoroseomonas arctica]